MSYTSFFMAGQTKTANKKANLSDKEDTLRTKNFKKSIQQFPCFSIFDRIPKKFTMSLLLCAF